MHRSDFLIIGSGIAGLTYALKLAEHFPDKTISIVTKSHARESNSNYAQGGIAAVTDSEKDGLEKHITDTLTCGAGLCDEDVVRMVVGEGPERIRELRKWGVLFDVEDKDELSLGLEGGHSANRIVHAKDHTGASVIQTLLKKAKACKNIHLFTYIFTVDLLLNKERSCCRGAIALNALTGSREVFLAHITMLASGGSGQVYKNTSNPAIATGDGIAMAYRAGAKIRDMEFVQFHPTLLYDPEADQPFLITEALRGAGAVLRNHRGEAFMRMYDPRADLASRDIVSRAIHEEIQASGHEYVFLDCRDMDIEYLRTCFPQITGHCSDRGIDLEKDMIPVVPAAHFNNGGIVVNPWGETSVRNLLACGECTFTGLHGANRLASNSLLEGLVYADRAYRRSCELIKGTEPIGIGTYRHFLVPDNHGPDNIQHIRQLTSDIRELMSLNAGIMRSTSDLKRTAEILECVNRHIDHLTVHIHSGRELFELRNLGIVALLIIRHSLQRQENRGCFYNVDLAGNLSDRTAKLAEVYA